MDTTTKSFASGEFLVDLTLRNDSLSITAENQVNWKVYTKTLRETDILSRFHSICSNPRDLFFALADGLTAAFSEITVSISHNGELNYCSRSQVGSQTRKNQFSIQLEEQRGETSIKNEKHVLELQNKIREHEREICKLAITLQQSEKKRLEESNKFHLMLETLNKKLDWMEQNHKRVEDFLLNNIPRSNGPEKTNPSTSSGPINNKPQAVNTNPLLASKLPIKNAPNTLLFGRSYTGPKNTFAAYGNPFNPNQAQPNPFGKQSAAYQGQTKQVTAFNNTYTPFTSIRGSLTPAPNTSKNNFMFWNIAEAPAATNLPNNTQSLFKLDPNNKLGKKLLSQNQTPPLFSPSKDPKNQLTPELLNSGNSQTKSPGIFLHSPQLTGHDSLDSAGNPLPQDMSRNFSFQQDREIEEKKEEGSVLSKSSPLKKMPTFSPDLVKITMDEIERQEKNQEAEVNDIILDTINFEVLTEEIGAAINKHKDTLLFLSLNDCALSSLQNLPILPKLVRLEITDNFLKPLDLVIISKMKEIQSLSLGGNYINNYEDLEPLKNLPKLVQLDLVGCSICFQADYHKKVFSMLESLEILDNRDVDGNEIDYEGGSQDGDEPSSEKKGEESTADTKTDEKK